MVTSPTKPSTPPRLSDVARHVVAPKGVVSSGWAPVESKCRELGIRFRWWQKPIGALILAKRADGKYAATIGGTGLSIPRQVGKTFLVGAIMFALCLLRPNLTVIWTAHRLRTAEETFGKMLKFAQRKQIAPYMLRPVLGSGEEEIRFRNGSRILFGARERGFGRGFDEVDVVVYDEGQILTENALDDMIPAMNQCRQETGALLLFMGTPPKPTDPGEVFARMREEALSGEDDDTGWVEFGSDPAHKFTPLPLPLTEADWKQIAKANPSYPEDTPREAILRMRKKLGEESFLREGAGIWDERKASLIFPAWSGLVGEPEAPTALGIAADRESRWLNLGCATEGFVSSVVPAALEDADRISVAARALFVSEVARISQEHDGIPVALQVKGPAWFLKDDLEAAGVRVVPIDMDEFVQACADFRDGVEARELRHPNTPDLNAAVDCAEWRMVGDRLVISRKSGDIAALEAALLARHAAKTADIDAWGGYS